MASETKQMVNRAGVEIPRRNCVDLHTPIERAIRGAVQAVESGPAHPRMTDAVLLLAQALDAVADAEEALNPNLASVTPPQSPLAAERGEREADSIADEVARIAFAFASSDPRCKAVRDLSKRIRALRARPALERLLAHHELPLSDEEGERLFDALQRLADAEPISEERLARIREGVFRRLGMAPDARPASLPAEDEPTLAKANAWADDVRLSLESRTHKPWSREGHLIVEIQAQLRDARAALGLRPGEPLRAVLVRDALPEEVQAAVERVRVWFDHTIALADEERADLRTLLAHLTRGAQ